MITTYAHHDRNAEVVTIYTSDALLVDRLHMRQLQRHIPLHEAIQDHLDVIGTGHTLTAVIKGTYGDGGDWVFGPRHIGLGYRDGLTTFESMSWTEDGIRKDQVRNLHALVTYALLLASDYTASSPL